jgi:glycosyltransferase involved in cell wall biosynthesis
MTKVCVVVNTFWPEIGAAPLRLSRWTDELHSAGCEVLVITTKPCYPNPKLYPKKVQENRPYPILRYGYWLYLGQSGILRLISMLSLFFSALRSLPKVLKFSPDVVVGQAPPPAMATLAWLFARLSRAAFVLNVSDLWPEAISELLGKKRLYILELWMRFLYSRSQAITAQSQEIADFLHSYRPSLFRAGADPVFFADHNPTASDSLRVVYVGTLGIAHGLLHLVKSFWPYDLSLTIVGDGYEKREIVAYLTKNSKKIQLVPAKPIEEIPSFLAEADLVLVCQKKTLFGTTPAKLYEAMAAGKPIWLHGSKGESADLVRQLGCGWVSDEENFELILTQILASSPQTRAQMGKNGRNFALQNLQGKIIAHDFAIFVKNIAQTCKKSP